MLKLKINYKQALRHVILFLMLFPFRFYNLDNKN